MSLFPTPGTQRSRCFFVSMSGGTFSLYHSFTYLFPTFTPPEPLKVLFKTYPIAPSSQPRSRRKISSSLSVGVMRVDGSGEAVARRWRGGGEAVAEVAVCVMRQWTLIATRRLSDLIKSRRFKYPILARFYRRPNLIYVFSFLNVVIHFREWLIWGFSALDMWNAHCCKLSLLVPRCLGWSKSISIQSIHFTWLTPPYYPKFFFIKTLFPGPQSL